MSLLSPEQRKLRIEQKRGLILRWLVDHSWTHVSVLIELLGLCRRAVETTLLKMERDQLVRSAQVPVSYGRPITIWGITHHGLHHASEPDEVLVDRPVFEPSKVSASRIPHELQLQIFHVRATKAGWKGWESSGEISGRLAELGLKIPDAIAVSPKGEKVAIEFERTLKSGKRYRELLISHLEGRRRGFWKKILYVCPNVAMALRTQRAYGSIKTARYKGESFKVTPEHLAVFQFRNLAAALEAISSDG